jgi:hypothetical protein
MSEPTPGTLNRTLNQGAYGILAEEVPDGPSGAFAPHPTHNFTERLQWQCRQR